MAELTISKLMLLAILLRIGFFLFGIYQDKYFEVKYTDIDYVVFTDASKYVCNGLSPYMRETYRYTPLLAWLLVPTSIPGLYSWGKFLFILSDLITGYIIIKLLEFYKVTGSKKIALSSIWLLNPMVITISTRGSSESLLAVLIMSSVYFLVKGRVVLAGLLAGLSVHMKLYPIIYLPTFILFIQNSTPFIDVPVLRFFTYKRVLFGVFSMFSLLALNIWMTSEYGLDFLYHSYFYHLTRSDHRHNFSVYNISLYLKSSLQIPFYMSETPIKTLLHVTNFAFLPQFLISFILIPLIFAQKDLIACLFLQTYSFVMFNKVITSQYFIWFLIFLPLYLRESTLIGKNKSRGAFALVLWVVSQASWLHNAYKLEFLGINTFNPALLLSSCFFFLANAYILGLFFDDVGQITLLKNIKKNV